MKNRLFELLQKTVPWLHRVLSEGDGTPSSTRLIAVGWHLAVGVVWLSLCAYHRTIVKIDESVLGVLGIVTGGKVVQRFGESASPAPDAGDKASV